MISYLVGSLCSFIVCYIYINYFNTNATNDKKATLVLMSFLSWGGVFITCFGIFILVVNYTSKEK